jgi:large subunit ribosomal protein L21e
MTSHKGYRAKTRRLHRKEVRKRGLGSVDKYLMDFEIGSKVDIITDPSEHKLGMPYKAFHGKTGTVIGTRGRCFEVEIKIGNSKKKIIVGKPHLRLTTGIQS